VPNSLQPSAAPWRSGAQHETEDHVSIDKQSVIAQLNRILECELAGVVRYTHYSMMIFGYSRIPIVAWFQQEASESLTHAQQAGEMVTRLGGHPSLAIGPLLETHQHDIGQILRETLQAEHVALGLYTDLLKLVAGKSVAIEEYARGLIEQEEAHIDEIDKMLRKPGDVEMSKEARDLS
jgi:bacterioferritin